MEYRNIPHMLIIITVLPSQSSILLLTHLQNNLHVAKIIIYVLRDCVLWNWRRFCKFLEIGENRTDQGKKIQFISVKNFCFYFKQLHINGVTTKIYTSSQMIIIHKSGREIWRTISTTLLICVVQRMEFLGKMSPSIIICLEYSSEIQFVIIQIRSQHSLGTTRIQFSLVRPHTFTHIHTLQNFR